MKKLNSKESGLCIIPDKNDKSAVIDDGLHAFVCPHCGNDIFEGENIVCYEGAKDWRRFSCWGGFGIEEYTWIPHKCTACNTKFLAWTAKKKVHGPVIGYFIGMMICAALTCADIACAITIEPTFVILLLVLIPIIICCLFGIEEETFSTTDNPMKEMIDRACFPTDEEEEQLDDVAQELSDRIDDSLQSLAFACAVTPEEAARAMGHFRIPMNAED